MYPRMFSNEDAKSAQLNVVDDDDLAFAEPAARRDTTAKKDRCSFCSKVGLTLFFSLKLKFSKT